MSLIVNVFAGPGTGKSTLAAGVYTELKLAGINAEMAREYVKSWAWEGRQIGPFDQIYFMGKQARTETMLYRKASVIITDCPLLLGVVYAERYSDPRIAKAVEDMAMAVYRVAEDSGHRYFNIMLSREKKYVQDGRYESEDQAREVDRLALAKLVQHNLPYLWGTSDSAGIADISSMIINETWADNVVYGTK